VAYACGTQTEQTSASECTGYGADPIAVTAIDVEPKVAARRTAAAGSVAPSGSVHGSSASHMIISARVAFMSAGSCAIAPSTKTLCCMAHEQSQTTISASSQALAMATILAVSNVRNGVGPRAVLKSFTIKMAVEMPAARNSATVFAGVRVSEYGNHADTSMGRRYHGEEWTGGRLVVWCMSARQTWLEDQDMIRDAIARGYGLDHEQAAALLDALERSDTERMDIRARSHLWREDVDRAGVTWDHVDVWLAARGITYDCARESRDRVGGDERIHLINRMAGFNRMDAWRVLDEMAVMDVVVRVAP
jgi:hypothetical protein